MGRFVASLPDHAASLYVPHQSVQIAIRSFYGPLDLFSRRTVRRRLQTHIAGENAESFMIKIRNIVETVRSRRQPDIGVVACFSPGPQKNKVGQLCAAAMRIT
jgi:hypothetical protein